MQADIYNKEGSVAGSIDLNDKVFAIEPNENAMHQAVVVHLAHKRQGTAKTKTRDEVSGGGKKPWKQKGRGTARAGSTRSPLWVGGGTIHGPRPHAYNVGLPKKLNRLSRRSALSLRVSEKNLKFVQDFSMPEIKTKSIAQVLKNFEINRSTLIITPANDTNMYLSARNIPKTSVRSYEQVSTYDILNHKNILMLEGAVKPTEELLTK